MIRIAGDASAGSDRRGANFVERDTRQTLLGFVANRAHHADIGGISAGSMPLSQEIYQEGVIIPPVKLMIGGRRNEDVWRLFLANVRTPEERSGDLLAQMAANRIGIERMQGFTERFGVSALLADMKALLRYSERMTRHLIGLLPDGCYRFEEALDNDGFTEEPVVIQWPLPSTGNRPRSTFRNGPSAGGQHQCGLSCHVVGRGLCVPLCVGFGYSR